MDYGHKTRLFDDWATAQEQKLRQAHANRAKEQREARKYRHPVTELQEHWLALLYSQVTYPPATAHKRFARDMAHATEITYGQSLLLAKMVYRYRRQLRLTDDAAKHAQASRRKTY